MCGGDPPVREDRELTLSWGRSGACRRDLGAPTPAAFHRRVVSRVRTLAPESATVPADDEPASSSAPIRPDPARQRSGRRGRGFKSRLPDHQKLPRQKPLLGTWHHSPMERLPVPRHVHGARTPGIERPSPRPRPDRAPRAPLGRGSTRRRDGEPGSCPSTGNRLHAPAHAISSTRVRGADYSPRSRSCARVQARRRCGRVPRACSLRSLAHLRPCVAGRANRRVIADHPVYCRRHVLHRERSRLPD